MAYKGIISTSIRVYIFDQIQIPARDMLNKYLYIYFAAGL